VVTSTKRIIDKAKTAISESNPMTWTLITLFFFNSGNINADDSKIS
jgi:hypothetical protein